MRLIDADKYRDSLEESWKKCHEWHDEADTEEIRIRAEQAEITFMECILRLKDQPTVDAQPVRHGRFIGTEYDGYADGNPVYYEWKCSECGCVFEDEEPTYNYCPNCGADMRGEKE